MSRAYTYVKSQLTYYKRVVKNNKDIIYPDGSSLLSMAKNKVKELTSELEKIKKAEGRA